jgi:cell division transport system permease protein
VDEASFAQDVAERLGGLVDRLKGLGRGLSGALVLAAMFIIFATIRLALLAHQEEIQILKIIGASSWFVRGPYLVQGAGQGAVAAILALALLVGFQVWLNLGFEAALSQEMSGLNLRLNFLGPGLALELLAASVLAGLTGAGLALGRVMKE